MDWKIYNSPTENLGVYDFVDRENFLLPEYVNTNPKATRPEEMVMEHVGDTPIMISRLAKHNTVNVSFVAPEFKFLMYLPESVITYQKVKEIITYSIHTKLNKHYFITKLGYELIQKGRQELQYDMVMDYTKADKEMNQKLMENGVK